MRYRLSDPLRKAPYRGGRDDEPDLLGGKDCHQGDSSRCEIRKQGLIIGYAFEAIAPGTHIHTRDPAFATTDHAYDVAKDCVRCPPPATPS